VTELGNRLKEARLAKGLSLDDLQTMTKIQKRYLTGIEEGNYSSMPGDFYVRAFIKQYVEALDLDPEEIFETYKNEIPATHTEELPQQLSRVKTHKVLSESNSKVFDILPKILIAIVVIGVASVLYYFITNNVNSDSAEQKSGNNDPVTYVKSKDLDKAKTNSKTDDTTKDQQKETDQNKAASDEEKTSETEVPKQEMTVAESSGKNTTYSLKNADKFVVKLVSKGQTWVSVKNGKGKSFFQGMLQTGATDTQTVDLSAESEAVIVVGRTLDTDIFVNDQKLEYAVSPSKVVRQNITIQYVPKNE